MSNITRFPRPNSRPPLPRDVIALPLRRVSPHDVPAFPSVPLNLLGNDALRKVGRDIVAEMMRRARASQNAWDGDRLTLDEIISWLGGETYDARLELTSKTVGLDVGALKRKIEEGAP